MNKKRNPDNPGWKWLGTHQAGAADLHQTRTANKENVIDPPEVKGQGTFDPRDDDDA